MTAHAVTDDILGQVARKEWELERRLREGTLPPNFVLAGLQKLIEGPQVHDLFVTPEEQITNVVEWCHHLRIGLGQGLERIERTAPPSTVVKGLTVNVLVPYTSQIQTTVDVLWGIATQRHGKFERRYRNVRPLQRASYLEPGVRWEIIDLGAFTDERSVEATRNGATLDGLMLAGAGVLAAAAHFPKWVLAMRDFVVPSVAIGGFETYSVRVWNDVPTIQHLSSKGLVEGFIREDVPTDYAVPALRGFIE